MSKPSFLRTFVPVMKNGLTDKSIEMNLSEKHFCLILAGGKGRRLWPCSRETNPKQFIDFFGTGRTQLQQTYDRMARVIPRENIYVSTTGTYVELVKEQLPDLLVDNLLVEPVQRNTAPSVAWAAFRIQRVCPEAQVVITPSDQAVYGDEAFDSDIRECLEFVAGRDGLVAMGVKPTRPEPGYGYIQKGEEAGPTDLYHVKSFTEKPDRHFAQMFMESGEFLWNTGIYVSNVRNLTESLGQILPVVLRKIAPDVDVVTMKEEIAYVKDNFSKFPNLSIESGLLENSAKSTFVMKCNFGWADLGTWHSIFESKRKTGEDNVVIDSEVILEDSKDNIIKMPKGHLAVINGLEGYIVAEAGDVLLICKKGDSSALIRKYVNEVRLKYGESFV